MLTLAPVWSEHVEEFWEAVTRRNFWFVRLRYYAVLLLVVFVVVCDQVFRFRFTSTQAVVFIGATVFILSYNILFRELSGAFRGHTGRFNPMHLSLLQMVTDLFSLGVLVYFTGGIESPLLFLFIFHMIIGSMILPNRVMYTIAGIICCAITLFAVAEYTGFLEHHPLAGFFVHPLYRNPFFLVMTLTMFIAVICACVFLAGHIAAELYKREEDLHTAFDQLSEAEREKQRYIMAVVHEIKTPVSASVSFLNIILQKILGDIPAPVEEKLVRVQARCMEAIDMINNVLRVSRMKLLEQMAAESIDVDRLIQRALEKYQAGIEAKALTVVVDDKRETPLPVVGDTALLDLVLSNLVSNAIKYTPDAGTLLVTMENEQQNVLLRIEDSGVGIPQSEINNLFSNFFRATNIRNGSVEGTGVGLSVVKQIVDKHNGSVNISSPSALARQGFPGTTVFLRLPLKSA